MIQINEIFNVEYFKVKVMVTLLPLLLQGGGGVTISNLGPS